MTKSINANQTPKLRRPYLQPIYLIHLSVHWAYKGYYGGNSTAACAGSTPVILNQYSSDDWSGVGILAGDLFKFDNESDESRIAVLTVDSDDQVTLVSNHSAQEGWTYIFEREGTLYFSDRNYKYNNHDYEAYLLNLSDIENRIRNLGGYDNPIITFHFRNKRFRNAATLIEYFDTWPIEKQYIEVYKLLINTGETFETDVSTLIWKGEIGQPYEITESSFKVDCTCMLFGKNAMLPLDVIDLADFSSAHKNDVGKYRNILYGDLDKVVCLWTSAGWESTLAASIDADDTSVTVSDIDGIPSLPFTMMCDNEEIRLTAGSNPYTATRGYNSTTARSHTSGTVVYYKTNWTAEVAQHPVKSIGNVYGKRGSAEWFAITSGLTKYISSGGRAFITFTNRPKFGGEGDLSVALTEEPHSHDVTGMNVVTKECIPTGYVQSGADNPGNVIDGNTSSYAGIDESDTVGATFTESNLGTIAKEIIHIYKNSENATGYVQCPSGTNLTTLGSGIGWFRVVKTSGMAWGDSVVVVGGSGGNQIGEIYKEIEYTPILANSEESLTPYITGEGVTDIVVADTVACDVEGYQDDGSGTYTGTASALIERPDHVRKHILIALLGFAAADIDASFGTVGTTYGSQISGGYKFAFNLPEVALQVVDLFRKMDEQSRSVMFESQGKFKLAFSPTSTPTSQLTFGNTTNPEYYRTKGDFVFSKTNVTEILNLLRAHYYRDYSKTGSLGDKYKKVREATDYDSRAKYGLITEDLEFSCIGDLQTMVDDVLLWLIQEKAPAKKMVDFIAFWDAMILEMCDYFTVVSSFWSGSKFRTIEMNESEDRKTIKMKGLEYVA